MSVLLRRSRVSLLIRNRRWKMLHFHKMTPPHIKNTRKTKDSMRVKENRCFMRASEKNIIIIIPHYSLKSNKRKKINKTYKTY